LGVVGRALAARAAPGLVPVLFDRWARAVDEASRAQTPRLLYEMAIVDLCAAEPMVPLGDLLQRLDELEVRLRSGGAAPAPSRAPSPPTASAGVGAQRSWGAAPPAAAGQAKPSPAKAVAAPAAEPAPRAAEPGPRAAEPASRAAEPAPRAAELAPEDPAELWRRVLGALEVKRPRVGALLAHAEVVAFAPGSITLALPDKFTADQAERHRAEIESAVSEEFGRATRVAFSAGHRTDATVRSVVGVENDAASADRKTREQEARQHPVIRRAQDLFGASLKEIKT
jgi:DNA polymerase-3 subunit gamma/tau